MTDHDSPPHGPPHRTAVRGQTPPKLLWQRAGSEPSLESLFGDPVLLAVLARNRVSVEQLRALSASIGDRLLLRGAD